MIFLIYYFFVLSMHVSLTSRFQNPIDERDTIRGILALPRI